MEYTQWGFLKFVVKANYEVLILVVMEYTQWAIRKIKKVQLQSLNPCCNGIYSMS